MSIYRGKLDRSRPYQGIQVVAYDQVTSNKVDTVISDKDGYFQFNTLSPGSYNVYFYGGGYQDEEYITIFVTDQGSNTQFYISPENGTVIKNGSGTLSVQLKEIFNGEITNKTSGPVKLYIDNNGTFELLKDQAGVTSSSDWKGTVPASLVEPILNIFAVADANSANEFIYDSITLADITDGVGFIGWATASSYVAIKDEEGNFSPSSLTLTPNFAIDGSQITLDSDADFSFTSLPTADAPNGIAVNSDTGVVTITSSDYFDSEVSFTATWTAEYSVGEQTFIFSITETVYTVENGSTARTLKVISDSQVFKKEKESSTLSPNYITLTTEKTNLSSETVNWSSSPSVVFYDSPTGGSITTTGDTVYVRNSSFGSNEQIVVTATITTASFGTYIDKTSIVRLEEGSDAISVVLSNEAHSFTADEDADVSSYLGGGTDIEVYEGTTQLAFGSELNSGEFEIAASVLNITAGTVTNDGFTVTYGSPTNMTQNTASITFEVSGKRQDGTAFTVTKVQSLTKSVAGSNARTLKLEQTGLTFTRPQNTTTLDPGFIELNTSSSNLGGETVTFSTPVGVDLYTASTGGAVTTTATVGTPVYLRNSEFAGNTSVLVTATVSNSYGTFTDQSTFIELEEGKNSIASLLTNESHSFAADEDADVLSYTGGGTDIRIYEGATPLTYGTGDGQFTVSATVTSGTVTIGTATTVTTSTTNDTRRFGNPSGLDTVQASITFTISGKRQDGTVFSLTRIQSLTKSVAGSNARFIKLVTDGLTFSRPKNTTTLDPGFITLDTEHNNLSGSTVTYSTLPEVDLYDASSGGSVATTAVAGTPLYIRNSDFATNSPVVVTVTVSNSYGTFIDKATLVQLDEGSDSVQVVFDNEAHTFQADQDGTISDYSAGALNINVYEGTTQLDVGTGNGEYQVSASASNITAGTESDDGTTTTFGAPLNMTSTGASVAYTISGKRQDGTAFSFDKIQTFSKSLAGQDAYTLSMNMLSYTVEEQNDESLDAFSVDIEGTIFKGSVNKTADYQISAIEAYTQAGAPNQEASLGLGSFTPDGTTSITVDTLTADFVRLELTFSDTVGDGPDLLNSVNFNKQKAGRQGPGVLYIGEFDDLAGTRVLNNNDNARDVISDSGDYYAFIGTDGTLANAASSIPGTDWEVFNSFSAFATGLFISDNSFVKETINVGLNAEGNAANIAIVGGSLNPYISVGQASQGYNNTGIFFGVDSGTAKLSLKGTDSLLWDGSSLTVTGDHGGTIAGWTIDSSRIYKASSGNTIEISSTAPSFRILDQGIERIFMGLGTPLDIASQVNEGYLSGANWTLQNNDFDSYAYGSAALSTKTGSVVSIDGSSSGALEDDVDNFEIRRNIGNIAADTNFSIKGISNIYVDTSATCTLTVDVYEDASTTPVKINDLSASVSLSTTSGIEKSGQILSLTTYSASAYSDVEIRLTIETEITSGNATIIVIDLTDFEIYVSVPYVQTTATSYTLFNSKSTYLQWDKENFVIKGVDLNADEATIGNLVVDGTTVFRGDVTVAGSLASHPNITGAADVDNSNGVVLQDLDFDAFGHVLSTGTVDLDSRYIQITPSADEQTVNSDLTIIGRVTVQGNLTTVDSSVVTTSDNIIGINEGEVSAGISAVYGGMELDRGTLNPQRLIFRETDDLWRAGEFTGSITYTAGSGTFQVGEAISGTGSGAGATIISDSGTVLTIKNINGAFADAETIVGQTSGADATVDSSTKIDSTLRLAFIQDSPIDTAVSYFDSSTGTLKTSSDFTWTQGTGVLNIDGNITLTGTVDGRNISSDGSNLDNLYTTIGLSALTSAEVNQLENIGTNTISATQWGYLGALDQGLTTSSNVEFNLIIGDGSGLTSLNADYITSGTLPSGRLTGSYTGITGVGALVAGSISSGFGAIDIGSSSLSAGSGTFNGTFLVKDTEPYIELWDTNALTDNKRRRIYTPNQNIYISSRNDDGSLKSNDFTLLENGNVGIGTTTPSVKLEVSGGATFSGDVTSSGDFNALASVRFGSDGAVDRITASGGDMILYATDDFRFYPNTQGTNWIQISDNGNILPVAGFVESADLGGTGNRWGNVYSVDGNFSGTVTVNGSGVVASFFQSGVSDVRFDHQADGVFRMYGTSSATSFLIDEPLAVGGHSTFTADAISGSEDIATFKVSDDSLGYLKIANSTNSTSSFQPSLHSLSKGEIVSRLDVTYVTDDTGSNPAYILDARTSANSALSTRAIADFRTLGSSKLLITSSSIESSVNVNIGGATGTTRKLMLNGVQGWFSDSYEAGALNPTSTGADFSLRGDASENLAIRFDSRGASTEVLYASDSAVRIGRPTTISALTTISNQLTLSRTSINDKFLSATTSGTEVFSLIDNGSGIVFQSPVRSSFAFTKQLNIAYATGDVGTGSMTRGSVIRLNDTDSVSTWGDGGEERTHAIEFYSDDGSGEGDRVNAEIRILNTHNNVAPSGTISLMTRDYGGVLTEALRLDDEQNAFFSRGVEISNDSANASILTINSRLAENARVVFQEDSVNEYALDYLTSENSFRLYDYANATLVWEHDQDDNIFSVGVEANFSNNLTVDRTITIRDANDSATASLSLYQTGAIDTLLRSDGGTSYIAGTSGELAVGGTSQLGSAVLSVHGDIQSSGGGTFTGLVEALNGIRVSDYDGSEEAMFEYTSLTNIASWRLNGVGSPRRNHEIQLDYSNGINFLVDDNAGGVNNVMNISRISGDVTLTGGLYGTTVDTSDRIKISSGGDGAELLRFNTERAWLFKQTSTGSTSNLALKSTNDNKNFEIVGSVSDADVLARFRASSLGHIINFYSTLSVEGLTNLSGGIRVNGDFTVDTDGGIYTNALATFADDIYPELSYTSNIGSPTKKFLTAHIAELRVETIVADERRSTIGGRLNVGLGNILTRNIGTSNTTLYFKHNNLTTDDIIHFEKDGSVEFIEINSTGVLQAEGDYAYTASVRDLDGTGANSWDEGDGVINTGTVGTGFIDIYSTNSLKTGVSTAGSTIAFMQRTGTGYNAISERAIAGNLKGWYGYSTDIYGAAFGDYSGNNITVDPTNGLRIRNGSSIMMEASANLLTVGSGFQYNDTTSTLLVAGWTANATSFRRDNDIVLDATNKRLSIANDQFLVGYDVGGVGNHGVYIDANDYWYGTGIFSLGSGKLTYDGTTLIATPDELDINLDANNRILANGAGVTILAETFNLSSVATNITETSFSFAGGILNGNTSSLNLAGFEAVATKLNSSDGSIVLSTVTETSAINTTYLGTLPVGSGSDYIGMRVYGATTNDILGITVRKSTSSQYFLSRHGDSNNEIAMGDLSSFAGVSGKGIYIKQDSDILFRVSNSTAEVAGWDFTVDQLSKGSEGSGEIVKLRSSDSVHGGTAIDFYDGGATPKGLSVKWRNTGNAGQVLLGEMFTDISGNPDRTQFNNFYGVQMMDESGKEFFALGALTTGTTRTLANRIAGWKFIETKLSSTNNSIELISTGDGRINVGTDFWDGDTSFQFGGSSGITKAASGSITIGSNVVLDSSVTISYSSVTGTPSSLSDINGTEGTKLTGIASGATVGADWDTNLSNIPDSATASYITSTEITATTIQSPTIAGNSGIFSGYVSANGMRFGANVSGTDDGIWIDSDNYWYQSKAFRFGGLNGINYDGSNNIQIGTDVDIFGNLSVSSLPAPSFDLNLTTYFSFDSGSKSAEVGDNSYTWSGTSDYQQGVSNDCVVFDGSSYITLDTAPVLDWSVTGKTISFYFKLDSLTSGGISGDRFRLFGESGSLNFLDLIVGSGDFVFHGEQTSNSTYWGRFDTGVAADTEWHHATFRIVSGETTLFLDGVKISETSGTTVGGANESITIPFIGRGNDGASIYGDSLIGKIDEFRIYDVPLTDSQAKSLYLNPPTKSGTISAERVRTGVIESTGYGYTSGNYSDVGTQINLDTGNIYSEEFSIIGGSAFFKGTVSVGSSGIGNFTDAGNLATLDTVGTSQIDDSAIELAKLGTTIITGGYIKTSLLDVNDIIASGSIIVSGDNVSDLTNDTNYRTGTQVDASITSFSNTLGNAAFIDAYTEALGGVTLITGGYISTGLISADRIDAGFLNAGRIEAGSIDVSKLSVTDLASITADLGTVTAGSIVIGSTNKLWLNDASDGALNIGGTTKGSAPFRVTNAGALTATDADITGDITATTGAIGGWDIDATSLSSGTNIVLDSANKLISVKSSTFGSDGIQLDYNAGNPRFYAGDGANKYFNFDGTNLSWKAQSTELNTDGELTATSAILTGSLNVDDVSTFNGAITVAGSSITLNGGSLIAGDVTLNLSGLSGTGYSLTASGVIASAGTIAGFTIDGTEGLYAGTGATRVQMKTGAGFWAGATAQSSAPFRVTAAGVLTAQSGTVGGWTLGTSSLTGGNVTLANDGNITVGTGDDVARLSSTDGTYRLWIGDATAGDAPFRVEKDGSLYSISGEIGGFSIGADSLGTTFSSGSTATRLSLSDNLISMGAGNTQAANNRYNSSSFEKNLISQDLVEYRNDTGTPKNHYRISLRSEYAVGKVSGLHAEWKDLDVTGLVQEESYFHYRFDDTIGGAEDGGYWETDTSIKVSDSLFIGTLEVNNTDKEVSRFLGVETDPTSHLSTGVRDGDWYYVKNVAYASSPSIADGLYMRADSTWIKVS